MVGVASPAWTCAWRPVKMWKKKHDKIEQDSKGDNIIKGFEVSTVWHVGQVDGILYHNKNTLFTLVLYMKYGRQLPNVMQS